jgi:hypothetical protein
MYSKHADQLACKLTKEILHEIKAAKTFGYNKPISVFRIDQELLSAFLPCQEETFPLQFLQPNFLLFIKTYDEEENELNWNEITGIDEEDDDHTTSVSGWHDNLLNGNTVETTIAIEIIAEEVPIPRHELERVHSDVRETLRHEIQHALQNIEPDTIQQKLEDEQFDKENDSTDDPNTTIEWIHYLTDPYEVDAFMMSLILTSKKHKTTVEFQIDRVLNQYREMFNAHPEETKYALQFVKEVWMNYLNNYDLALSR